ncbi:MAG: double-strand break repair helicase AddA [Sphingomonas sp.]
MSSASTGALPELRETQRLASAPDGHVWLSASAGTGKTQVLAARVFRLLLRGVDPGAILCLTFTKAGAAEMSARISQRLAAWVRMPETDLVADLDALGEDARSLTLRARARTLFANVLDAPGGGVRIQTIHGFCQSLLSAFPIEAGIAPGFRPIEAREEAALAREALAEMLLLADLERRTRPVQAIGALSVRLGEQGAEGFLRACVRAAEAMAALPVGDGIAPFIRRALDLPGGDVEEVILAACTDQAFDIAALRRIAAANRLWGTATGGNNADIVECWIKSPLAARAQMLADLLTVPFTAKGEPRKYSVKLIEAEQDYDALALALGECCAGLLDLRARAAYADLLAQALDVGRDYAATYARAKRRVGAVDFDDLIEKTIALLGQPGMGEWVRYKLDQATDHILIDEAQDTNPDQWAIIHAMAGEFFAGLGSRGERLRTLFTVGDFKQAIFGFQGTDPLYFRGAEQHFTNLAHEAWAAEEPERQRGGKTFARSLSRLSLTQSFRSTLPVLEFVDAALDVLPGNGMGALAEREIHASEVPGAGTVSLWPLVTAGGSEDDEEGWIADSTRELAARIALWIRRAIAAETPKRDGTPLRPEDVMILVKRRGELASLIVARLYAEGVAVAGIDRLRLNAPLAAQDLLAAIRFVLQPEDDLSLANLLVSPLIGWSQEQLMAAAPRGSLSLWRHLTRTQDDATLAPLRAILARADFTTPYRFLEELLSGPLDGRRKLMARLGQEARDPIEELLGTALSFETTGTPSLQHFLDWFDRGEVEIKRDPSAPLDAVRVMTVHGAKGLQAPLVILADAAVDPSRSPRSTLDWVPDGFDHALPIFPPRSNERGPVLTALVEANTARELEEHWRLFYVAATRAEEHLIVAGSLGPLAKGEPPPDSWYAAASAALVGLKADANEQGVLVFKGRTPAKSAPSRTRGRARSPAAEPVPAWARQPAPREAKPPRPLAPSSLGEDDVADPPPSPSQRLAAERGRLMHALFERLPVVATKDRRVAADRLLASMGGVVDAALRKEMIDTVLAVIDDARFANVFGPAALAEAPIAAVVADGTVVTGTVDRLLVQETRITVLDFKTGRAVPPSIEAIPAYQMRQMAAYRAALQVIFPERTVDAMLLYTTGPTLFTLPYALLDEHAPGFVAIK